MKIVRTTTSKRTWKCRSYYSYISRNVLETGGFKSMKKWKVLLMCLLGSIGLFTQGYRVFAADEAPAIGFSAEAQLPTNQVDSQVSYFNVGLKPNEEETLHVKLTNTTDKEITIEPAVNRARTNAIGVIEYNEKSKKVTANAQSNIEDLATISEKEIKLAPKAEYDLNIQVKMPDKELSGVQAGAIYLLQKGNDTEKGNIKNQFAREIGLLLQSSDPNTLDSHLSLTKATASQMNARNTTLLTLENNQPKFMKLTDVHATMKKKGADKVLYETKQKNMTIAPNTQFDFPISLEGNEFQPGTYVASFQSKEGNKTWQFTKEFTVTNQESKQLNQTDAVLQNKPSFIDQYKWAILLGMVLLIIIVGLVIYLARLKKQAK